LAGEGAHLGGDVRQGNGPEATLAEQPGGGIEEGAPGLLPRCTCGPHIEYGTNMAMSEPMPLDLYDGAFLADPYPLLSELREAAPVHWVTQHRSLESWIVTRYDEVRAVLGDPRFI